ncbi:collagen alpha-1(XVIII) chain-like [Narcine bancroftii]|uniref:collagen alpha-1(XVIII) chain-like n=1 Tax=Narcine bancroftii TaxID=1343680 RepID=UPI003831C8A5
MMPAVILKRGASLTGRGPLSESRKDHQQDVGAEGSPTNHEPTSLSRDPVHEAFQTQVATPPTNQLSHDALGCGHHMGGDTSDGQSPLSNWSTKAWSRHDGIVLDDSRQANNPAFNRNATNGVLAFSAGGVGATLSLLTLTKVWAAGRHVGLPQALSRWTGTDSDCTPLPPTLNFCRPLGHSRTQRPDPLEQASPAELRDALAELGGLLSSRCHPALRPFLCLLLPPSCHLPTRPPPCRGYCESVRDGCWTELVARGLQLACHPLPDEEEGYACLSLNVSRGKQTLTETPPPPTSLPHHLRLGT